MSDSTTPRVFPRWLHVLAIVNIVAVAVLLVFGELVTTLRAGMADPEWPTVPWHLALDAKEKWSYGYLVEHTHRIIGFLVGGLTTVLTIGLWATDPRKGLRWGAIVGLVLLLAGFGYFHGQMIAQKETPDLKLPVPSIAATVAPLALLAAICLVALRGSVPGSGVCVLSVVTLVSVMIQGLLGGLRVRLDQLIGPEFAAIHGTFATFVFAALFALVVLTSAKSFPPMPDFARRKLGWQTTSLIAFTVLQIAFGAWIRHFPDKASTRLHLFLAFWVVGFATLVIKQALSDPLSKQRLRVPAAFMMALITVQVLFGVEAWVGKFMSGEALELRKVPPISQSFIRTIHAHVGAWILAVATVFWIRVRTTTGVSVGPHDDGSLDYSDRFPEAVKPVRQVTGV